MQAIPIQPVPNQILNVILSAQACTIKIYQRTTGLYVDLYVNNTLIIGGVLALNLVRIVRDAYLGFVGDIGFFDTQAPTLPDGSIDYADPDYTGLGARFQLIYMDAFEAGQTTTGP